MMNQRTESVVNKEIARSIINDIIRVEKLMLLNDPPDTDNSFIDFVQEIRDYLKDTIGYYDYEIPDLCTRDEKTVLWLTRLPIAALRRIQNIVNKHDMWF